LTYGQNTSQDVSYMTTWDETVIMVFNMNYSVFTLTLY